MENAKFTDYNTLNQYMKRCFLESGETTSIAAACDDLIKSGDWKPLPALPSTIDADDAKMSDSEFRQLLDQMPVDLERIKTVLAATHLRSELHLDTKCFVYQHLPYSQSALHDHDMMEICHVHSGSCKVTMSGCEAELKSGDFLFIPIDLPHSLELQDKSSIVICIHLPKILIETTTYFVLSDKSYFNQYFRSMLMGSLRNTLVCRSDNNERIQRIIRQLVINGSLRTEEPLCNVIPGIVVNLIDLLTRHAQAEFIERSSNRSHDRLLEVLNYIRQNFSTVTLSSVAEKFHFNRTYLSQMIKNSTGRSFTEHLTQVRLDISSTILIHTTLPISKVCEQVGYGDVTHFIRAFKKYYGQTPQVYRKAKRIA